MLLLCFALLPIFIHSCEVQVPTLSLLPQQYEGAWFVVARKNSASRSFLPPNVTSSLIRLTIDGDHLNMTEYHSVNLQCRPPLEGVWKKSDVGYIMELRTESGLFFSMPMRAIYHGYSGEQNEEMNLVVYGCQQPDSKGNCPQGEELVMVMSNSRHPQTQELFKSAKLIEDSACIDILHFKILETYTACGDEIVDEDQKLLHASIDENNEFVDVECKVVNFRFKENNASTFFVGLSSENGQIFQEETRVLTVIAYIDPLLSAEEIAHISCSYDSTTHAKCQWLRRNTCFNTELNQVLDNGKLEAVSNFTRLNGSFAQVDWSGQIIWENGDEYISMRCVLVDDDGGCDDYRIYVWSDEDHMDQPTINEIQRQLQAICVDPTDLVFLNTFHECLDKPAEEAVPGVCTGQQGRIPISPAIFQGVWYFAADLNEEPKIFLQSAVVNLTMDEKDPWNLHVRYYAQKESNSECVGPGTGMAILSNDSTLNVTIEYSYTLVPNHRNTLSFKYQVLYVDNQRAALYWCYRRAANGTCIQHDVSVMVRSRYFTHHDYNMITPSLEKVCIEKDSLRWFDLHSKCGAEMSSSSKLRRDLVTLSHYDVLHILTDVQEPRCLIDQLRGVKADFFAMEKAGPWFLVSRYDEMALDTYAMVGRVFAASNTSAVLRLLQSAALPGEPLDCYTRVFTMQEVENGTDYFYELHYEASTGNSTTMIFRFLFFNRHVGVAYSCLAYNEDGSCDEKAIYVISRHESIDHSELSVLETVARSVCVDPAVLYHTGTHDDCVYDYSPLKPPACSSVDETNATAEWKILSTQEHMAVYGSVDYRAVASSRMYPNPFILKFNGKNFDRISEGNDSCETETVDVEFSERNRLLAKLASGEVALIHPAPRRTVSEVLVKEAQLTGHIPCLNPVDVTDDTRCERLKTPSCLSPGPLKVAEDLHGEWLLYSADPTYVLNQRCVVTQLGDTEQHLFTCSSESWFGECERELKYSMEIDAWGGFKIKQLGPPLRVPSELFSKGNISVTTERLIMLRDGDLVGRRYSLWLRGGVTYNEELAADVEKYCIWPRESQIKGTDNFCSLP